MRTRSRSLAQQVAVVAARQHGVISRRQLRELGAPASRVQRWAADGHLHRVFRGVYAVGHARISAEGRWMAAVLACGPGAFLSHGPGGQLLGIVGRRERPALHVSLAGGADRSPAGIVTHRPRELEPADTTVRHGIPVTTGTRTVWDLAATLTALQTRRAFEQAEKLGLLDRSRLGALRTAAPNRRGAGVVRALLAERQLPLAETRSRLEEIVLEICHDAGLPLPLVNVPLLGWEVDFLWPAAQLVVEADGGDHLLAARRDRDNERDAALGRAGYLVRRFSFPATRDRDAVAAELRGLLAERLGGAAAVSRRSRPSARSGSAPSRRSRTRP